MPVAINGTSGVITGVATGGLPDGIVDTDMLASGAVATAKIADDAISSAKLATGAGGKILQVVQATKTDTFSESVGQGAESSQPFTASITPSSSSNKVLIRVVANGALSTTHGWGATLKKGSDDLFVGDADSNRHRITTGSSGQNTTSLRPLVMEYLDSPSTTSSVTYGFTMSHAENGTLTVYLNRPDYDTDATYILRSASSITLMEVAG